MNMKLKTLGMNESLVKILKDIPPLYRVAITDKETGSKVRIFLPVSLQQKKIFEIFKM